MESSGASSSSSSMASVDPQQSQWLRATLSDMNKRMKAMKTLLSEDENYSMSSENYDKRRLELFRMLEEFNNSYGSLAEKYDRSRSTLYRATDSGSIPASSSTNNSSILVGRSSDGKLEAFGPCLDPILGDPVAECGGTNFEYLKELIKEFMSTAPCDVKMKCDTRDYQCNEKATDSCNKKGINMIDADNSVQDRAAAGDLSEGGSEQGNPWSELEFHITNLMEENLRQQVELARRNIEKKGIINRLQLQLEHLKSENRDLQRCISCLKVDDKDKHLQTSNLRRMFSGRLFG